MGTAEPDRSAYLAVMEEIKRRTRVVHSFVTGKSSAVYRATHVECMVLQVRMMTELIALASLAANRELFERNSRKFKDHWHPGKILKDLESLNPNFYPEPVQELPSQSEGLKAEIVPLKGECLTKAELVEVHGRCGALLHAANPYGDRPDYGFYERMVPRWMERIRKLLNTHLIRVIDSERFHLVHMEEARDDKVHMYDFQRSEV